MPTSRSIRAAVLGATSVSFGTTLLAGCYTLQPVRGTGPVVGTQIAFTLNDAGRAALGGSMGPEIGRVEGRLASVEGGDYVVSVSSVEYIRGGTQVWRGEPVHIKPEYVGSVYERHLSKARSVALGAVAVGAIAALVTRSLTGSSDEPPTAGPDSTGHTSRGPRP